MCTDANVLELVDSKEDTYIKINGQEINRVQAYKLTRDGFNLNLELRISVAPDKSTIDIRREYGTVKY